MIEWSALVVAGSCVVAGGTSEGRAELPRFLDGPSFKACLLEWIFFAARTGFFTESLLVSGIFFSIVVLAVAVVFEVNPPAAPSSGIDNSRGGSLPGTGESPVPSSIERSTIPDAKKINQQRVPNRRSSVLVQAGSF